MRRLFAWTVLACAQVNEGPGHALTCSHPGPLVHIHTDPWLMTMTVTMTMT